MSIQASRVLDRVSTLLQDTGVVRRWPMPELLSWLNMAQTQIVSIKPDALSIVDVMSLTPGKTRQAVPDGSIQFTDPSGATLRSCVRLLDVVRNMGSDGDTPGRSISIVDRKFMDSIDPNWHSASTAAEVFNYTYDEKIPKIFYVIPAPVGAAWIEIVYTPIPQEITGAYDPIELPDEYEPILLDYVMFRALSKQLDSPDAVQRAMAYAQSYGSALQNYSNVEIDIDPNMPPIASASFRRS